MSDVSFPKANDTVEIYVVALYGILAQFLPDSINMLSVGPLYLHLNPKVVCSTRRWYANPKLNLDPKLKF